MSNFKLETAVYWILSITVILSRTVRGSVPRSSCEIKVKINNGEKIGFLMPGRLMLDPDDPCRIFDCKLQAGNETGGRRRPVLHVSVIQCKKIDRCEEGKSLFTELGKCCPECYHRDVAKGTESPITNDGDVANGTESWSEWSPWSSCHVTCGPGKRMRKRKCFSGGNELSTECKGQSLEISLCNNTPCANTTDGEQPDLYASEWSQCSVSCGPGGVQTMRMGVGTRSCNSQPCPAPLEVSLDSNSPIVDNNTAKFVLKVSKPTYGLYYKILGKTNNTKYDGSDIVIDGLQKNVYHEFVLGALSEDGEAFSLRRRFIIVENDACSVNLINGGISVDSNNATVEYSTVGQVSSVLCFLDDVHLESCNNPILLTNLEPGVHHLQIHPNGCTGHKTYPLAQTFTSA